MLTPEAIPKEFENDQVAQWKNLYDKNGGERSNLAHGYIRRNA